ncbi:MAG: amino acid ABC transporter permease/ATP-binding protein [Solirubrobacterales bacterium]
MDQFLHYLGLPFLWKGLLIAMEIAVASFLGAIPFAIGLAVMRLSNNRLLRIIPTPFIWVMRGTPILLQLLFWYNVLPRVGIHVSATITAIIGLGLNEIAFLAEIFRGGLQSVKQTQRDAAAALGMRPWQILRRVVIPQALRSITPSLGNEAIIIVKNTSLASVITVGELTLRSEQLVSANFEYVAVFLAAGVMYLIATSAIVLLQGRLEARLNIERKARTIAAAAARRVEAGLGTPALAAAGGADVEAEAPGRTEPDGGAASGVARWLRRMPGLRRDSQATSPPSPDAPPPAEPPKTAEPAATEAPVAAADVFPMLRKDATSEGMAADVTIENVEKSFHGRKVIKGVSLEVEQGSVVFLIGPSGSGKTTLLRTINHLESIDGGSITVGGEYVGYRSTAKGLVPTRDVAVARAKSRIGMVFQHFNLFDHLTVMENILEAPVRVYGRPADEVRREARALLAWAGLSGHEDHYPHQLSGGQQQRIAIIRALANHPRLMLFDEPTSALDPELVNDVLQVIRRLAEAGMTMVVVSHEIVAARDWADKVVFMEDGLIIEEGPPEQIFTSPQSDRTQRFVRMIAERGAGTGRKGSQPATIP